MRSLEDDDLDLDHMFDFFEQYENVTDKKVFTNHDYENNEYLELLNANLTMDMFLTFNGNVDLAKEYNLKSQSSFDFVGPQSEMSTSIEDVIENDVDNELPVYAKNNEINEQNHCDVKLGFNNNLLVSRSTTISRPIKHPEAARVKSLSPFQHANEPRSKYLLRSPKLLQEFWNSGDLAKIKSLADDIVVDDCILLTSTSPPKVGRDKVYGHYVSVLQNSPDFYILFNNIKKTSRRSITLTSTSFGTLPYVLNEDAKTPWNFFGMPLDKLDEFHKIQKQKYETLKSQHKVITFEKKGIWLMEMNVEKNRFTKIMAKQCFLEVFEK